MKKIAADAGIGVVAASNFSLGVALFQNLAEQAAKMFAPYPQYGAWIHEIHHSAKKDAPSGTAITLQQGMKRAGYTHQHRHGVEPRGIGAGHAHGRLRRPVRNDYDDAHESRSRGVCARRAASREVGAREDAAGLRFEMCWDCRRQRRDASASSESRWLLGELERAEFEREIIMSTPFTGVGTAIVTPFTKTRRARRSRRPPAGAASDRRGRSLSRAVRHDRREPDAVRRRANPHRRDLRRGSARQSAGAGRRRRIRH